MENGGLLDEVIFIARTNDVDDLDWLDHQVASTSGYTKRDLIHPSGDSSKVAYGAMWDVVERGTMYIKIDDDVVRQAVKVDLAYADKDCLRSSLIIPQLLVWSPQRLPTPNIFSRLQTLSITLRFRGYTIISA